MKLFNTIAAAAVIGTSFTTANPAYANKVNECSSLGQVAKQNCLRKIKNEKSKNQKDFEASDSGYGSHSALCGQAKRNCNVKFTDEGINAGKVVIPAGRFAGWTSVDKSNRTCNAFGVCYRGLLQKESQEFTISYLDIQGKKSKLLVSFVNGKAALNFKQELISFTQLAKASSGLAAPKYLTPKQASLDMLTSSEPKIITTIPFKAWVQAPDGETNNGKPVSRYYAPSLAVQIKQSIYEVPYLTQSGSITVTSLGRFDCRRGLVTSRVIDQSGLDMKFANAWSEIKSITPGQITFTAARELCK
jgi:hypothetical protein